jgi:hypothetical protein
METVLFKQNSIKEINTDFEVRSLDTASFNESSLKHPWWHKQKSFPGSAYRKCSGCKAFTCMVFLVRQ